MSIQSFADRSLRVFFETGGMGKTAAWRNIKKVLLRKLDMLHYAAQLKDLSSPPGNKLEALRGDLKSFYSIRVNDQWRIIFRWGVKGPEDVRTMDYHK